MDTNKTPKQPYLTIRKLNEITLTLTTITRHPDYAITRHLMLILRNEKYALVKFNMSQLLPNNEIHIPR